MTKYFLYIFIALGVLQSCVSRKTSDLEYLQNIDSLAIAHRQAAVNTLQPGDQLVILISAKDMDVVKPFNQNYSSGEMLQQIPAGGNILNHQVAVSGPTYIIDDAGFIDFPVLGTLQASGKSLMEFKEDLTDALTRYIKNPTVSVRHTNYKISVLGEVTRPGDYVIPNGKATIFNALGMAGDLTMYGKRDDVTVLRTENGETKYAKLNLKDANIINSEYYNLKQGDVIMVNANITKERTARLDPNVGIYISVASIVVTILALLFK